MSWAYSIYSFTSKAYDIPYICQQKVAKLKEFQG
jgi:hypothetical protein